MFQSKNARATAVAVILFSVGYFSFLAGCNQEIPDATPAAPSRADLFADPLGVQSSPSGAQPKDPLVFREQPVTESLVSLTGKVVDSRSLRPEVNCLISVDGQEVYSDSDGNFALENVRTGSDLRVRFRCRGLIERHVIRVPSGHSVVQLPDVIVIGRSLSGSNGAATTPSLRSTFSTAVDDLRWIPTPVAMAESNAEDTNLSSRTSVNDEAIRTSPSGHETVSSSLSTTPSSPSVTQRNELSVPEQPNSDGGPEPLSPPSGSGFMRSYDSLSVKPDEKIEGALSASQIHPELRRRVLAFYSCYANFLESDPMNRIHHMRVRWTIEADGTVSSSELLNSTERDAEKNQCLVRRLNRLVFPRSVAKTVVERTFIFGFRLDPMGQIP